MLRRRGADGVDSITLLRRALQVVHTDSRVVRVAPTVVQEIDDLAVPVHACICVYMYVCVEGGGW